MQLWRSASDSFVGTETDLALEQQHAIPMILCIVNGGKFVVHRAPLFVV